MIKTKLLISLAILFIASCSAQEKEIEKDLQSCIKQELKDLRPESTDFYKIMVEMEERMLAKGVLKDNKRKDYQNLFGNISPESEKIEEFYKENIEYLDNNFPFHLFLANDIIFNQCPYKVSSSNKEQQIYKQGELQNKIMESGFENLKLNKKLITNVRESDFQKIVYRAPVILLTLINIDRKFNPDREKIEEYKKDRHFLNKN